MIEQDDNDWSEYRKERQEKRMSNHEFSINFLKEKGIKVILLNAQTYHYRVSAFDFWPTTGKFYNQRSGEKGRGVRNLLKIVSKVV